MQLILGNFIILNLLLGIILGSFSEASDESNASDLPQRRAAAMRRLLELKRQEGALESLAAATRAELLKKHEGDDVAAAESAIDNRPPVGTFSAAAGDVSGETRNAGDAYASALSADAPAAAAEGGAGYARAGCARGTSPAARAREPRREGQSV